MKKLIFLLMVLFVMVGCARSTGIMPSIGGNYTVSKSGTTGFTPLGVLRKEAFEEINEFAKQKNKIPEIISVNEIPAGFAVWPQVDVTFRLIEDSQRKNEKPPTASIRGSATYDAKGHLQTKEEHLYLNEKIDIYQELEKLGNLKDKGILTDEEFQREKERLLNSNRN